ncbi:MAG: hypothetical protein JO323_07330 [Acidobacteriia bacterium]|nr:hypothetical protein [Terriglobia bacterium]
MRCFITLASFSLGLFAIPAVAHHSFAAEFDGKKCVVFEGVVTKIEWTNPHTYFFLNVKEGNGRVINWAFETAGPNLLSRLGWKRDSLKIGDRVRVEAYPAWDGAKIASARTVVMPDGKKMPAASLTDGGPQP